MKQRRKYIAFLNSNTKGFIYSECLLKIKNVKCRNSYYRVSRYGKMKIRKYKNFFIFWGKVTFLTFRFIKNLQWLISFV